jgi:hypothetical protein
MADEIPVQVNAPTNSDNGQAGAQVNSSQIHPTILNQTLGQLLQQNNQAQGVVMQAMQINPQQLQQLLSMTGNNQLMNTTIGDLFKNGFVQQAQGQMGSVSPQQLQQIVGAVTSQNPQQIMQGVALPQKQSFFQKLKNLFR